MNIRQILEEALQKGEKIKQDVTAEILKNRLVHDLVSSDLVSMALSAVSSTRDGVTRVIRDNAKSVLRIMDLPSRNDLSSLQKKLDHLEKVVDRVGKKAITVKSLKKIQQRKNHRSSQSA